MNRRLLLSLIVLLLACTAFAFYLTAKPILPAAPAPVEIPSPPSKKVAEPPTVPSPPAAAEESEAEQEPQTHTVRTRLQKNELVNQREMPDAAITLKKEKARELIPGVTIENKELSIQLEKENESLLLRRAKTPEEQVQMLWKQKF